MISGKKIYKKIQELKIDSEYIYGGSEEQSNIASRWNNDKLKVLISTTIGRDTVCCCRAGLMCADIRRRRHTSTSFIQNSWQGAELQTLNGVNG